MTDQEIVKATFNDPNSYALIVEKYESRILRYVKQLLYLSKEDAEDIVQEVFIAAYQYLKSYKEEYSFSSWLYRIAHNKSISYLRKHKNRKAREIDSTDSEWVENVISEFDTEKSANEEIVVEEVKRALKTLDENSKNVLILRYLEEKEYAEIADIIKTSEGNVASLIHRAKNKLKTIVKKNERS